MLYAKGFAPCPAPVGPPVTPAPGASDIGWPAAPKELLAPVEFATAGTAYPVQVTKGTWLVFGGRFSRIEIAKSAGGPWFDLVPWCVFPAPSNGTIYLRRTDAKGAGYVKIWDIPSADAAHIWAHNSATVASDWRHRCRNIQMAHVSSSASTTVLSATANRKWWIHAIDLYEYGAVPTAGDVEITFRNTNDAGTDLHKVWIGQDTERGKRVPWISNPIEGEVGQAIRVSMTGAGLAGAVAIDVTVYAELE